MMKLLLLRMRAVTESLLGPQPLLLCCFFSQSLQVPGKVPWQNIRPQAYKDWFHCRRSTTLSIHKQISLAEWRTLEEEMFVYFCVLHQGIARESCGKDTSQKLGWDETKPWSPAPSLTQIPRPKPSQSSLQLRRRKQRQLVRIEVAIHLLLSCRTIIVISSFPHGKGFKNKSQKKYATQNKANKQKQWRISWVVTDICVLLFSRKKGKIQK